MWFSCSPRIRSFIWLLMYLFSVFFFIISWRDHHHTINWDWRCAKIKNYIFVLQINDKKLKEMIYKKTPFFLFKGTSNRAWHQVIKYLPKCLKLNCKLTMRKHINVRNNESKYCRIRWSKHTFECVWSWTLKNIRQTTARAYKKSRLTNELNF